MLLKDKHYAALPHQHEKQIYLLISLITKFRVLMISNIHNKNVGRSVFKNYVIWYGFLVCDSIIVSICSIAFGIEMEIWGFFYKDCVFSLQGDKTLAAGWGNMVVTWSSCIHLYELHLTWIELLSRHMLQLHNLL